MSSCHGQDCSDSGAFDPPKRKCQGKEHYGLAAWVFCGGYLTLTLRPSVTRAIASPTGPSELPVCAFASLRSPLDPTTHPATTLSTALEVRLPSFASTPQEGPLDTGSMVVGDLSRAGSPSEGNLWPPAYVLPGRTSRPRTLSSVHRSSMAAVWRAAFRPRAGGLAWRTR